MKLRKAVRYAQPSKSVHCNVRCGSKNGGVRAHAARPFYPQEQTSSSACPRHVRLVPILLQKSKIEQPLKISRKLIFRPLCCCVAFQRHYGGP
jgi:hypothetical protein